MRLHVMVMLRKHCLVNLVAEIPVLSVQGSLAPGIFVWC